MTVTTSKKYLHGKEAREWADQMKKDKEEQKGKGTVAQTPINKSDQKD